MEFAILGRTGLKVSVAGLGGGGPSRLGQNYGRSESDAVAVVRRALDLGVNIIDTAESYDTEPAIGRAVAEFGRERVVLSTKAAIGAGRGRRNTPAGLERRVDASLGRLRTDHVEIFHLHAVQPDEYDYAIDQLVPAMLRMRDKGKLRFLGITEEFITDPGHRTLQRAVADDCWDVMMVGFNLLNQSARRLVFPQTRRKRIGTLIMFAVRRALSQPAKLRALLAELAGQGRIDPARFDATEPLGFLVAPGVADSIPQAAYRYCRHEPGCDVIQFGTGNLAHVEANVASLLGPPLPGPVLDKLADLFGRVDSVSGN